MRIDRVKLTSEMAQQEIKVSELAKKAGVSKATLSAAKNGKRCSESTGMKIAVALGVDPAEIIQGGA